MTFQNALRAYADPGVSSGPEIEDAIAGMPFAAFDLSWMPMIIDLMDSGEATLGEIVRVLVAVRKRYRDS